MKKADPEADRKTVAMLAEAINKIHADWRHPLWRSFFMGIMTALGATMGFALFVWVLGYILTALNIIPGISTLTDSLREFVEQSSGRR